MKDIKHTESQLKQIIKLSAKLYKRSEDLVNGYIEEKSFLNRIEQISNSFGLKFDIQFDVIIVSAEKKYLFNYLSGGFGDKNPKTCAKKISEFIYDTRFTDAIQHLSGRAIYDKSVIDRVLYSLNELCKLGYPMNKGSFFSEIKSLCDDIIKRLENNKKIILIGISSTEKLEPFDRLLAHEIFHLVLISNGIWFQGIKDEYENLDEGLTILLERKYSKRRKDISAGFWEDELMLHKEERIKKIKKLYDNLKNGSHVT